MLFVDGGRLDSDVAEDEMVDVDNLRLLFMTELIRFSFIKNTAISVEITLGPCSIFAKKLSVDVRRGLLFLISLSKSCVM